MVRKETLIAAGAGAVIVGIIAAKEVLAKPTPKNYVILVDGAYFEDKLLNNLSLVGEVLDYRKVAPGMGFIVLRPERDMKTIKDVLSRSGAWSQSVWARISGSRVDLDALVSSLKSLFVYAPQGSTVQFVRGSVYETLARIYTDRMAVYREQRVDVGSEGQVIADVPLPTFTATGITGILRAWADSPRHIGAEFSLYFGDAPTGLSVRVEGDASATKYYFSAYASVPAPVMCNRLVIKESGSLTLPWYTDYLVAEFVVSTYPLTKDEIRDRLSSLFPASRVQTDINPAVMEE
jgi:hypothetical protein